MSYNPKVPREVVNSIERHRRGGVNLRDIKARPSFIIDATRDLYDRFKLTEQEVKDLYSQYLKDGKHSLVSEGTPLLNKDMFYEYVALKMTPKSEIDSSDKENKGSSQKNSNKSIYLYIGIGLFVVTLGTALYLKKKK